MKLELKQIRFDGETQMRVEINGDAIHDYAEAIQSGATLPPIKLFFDGCDYWIGDGYHRWHATSQAGLNEIEADVVNGTRRDAILYAVGANAANGLRRTNEDKHKAVKTLLLDEEWSKWSDNVIAKRCGVSQPLVSGIRKHLITVIRCEDGQERKRGADGKLYRPRTSKPAPVAQLATVASCEPEQHDDEQQEFEPETLDAYGSVSAVDADDEPEQVQEKKEKPGVIQRFKPFWEALDSMERTTLFVWVNDQMQ